MVYVPPEYPGEIPEFAEVWPPVDDVNWMYTSAWDALVKEVRAIMTELGTDPAGASADVKTRLGLLALKTNVLELDNVTPFTPDADHEPATKKYVDDAIPTIFTDRGDPAALDFVVGDFTTDGTWRDLDLSGVVPAGAKAVLIQAAIQDDQVGFRFEIREKGNANVWNRSRMFIQVANIPRASDFTTPCDTDRTVEYRATNGVWTTIDIVIKGWWK